MHHFKNIYREDLRRTQEVSRLSYTIYQSQLAIEIDNRLQLTITMSQTKEQPVIDNWLWNRVWGVSVFGARYRSMHDTANATTPTQRVNWLKGGFLGDHTASLRDCQYIRQLPPGHEKIEGQPSIDIVYQHFILCFEAFPSYFMSFVISFFSSFQNCRQILNSLNIQAIISDFITNCQSQSPTVIDSVL